MIFLDGEALKQILNCDISGEDSSFAQDSGILKCYTMSTGK
jgi:hypothetical protein